MVSKISLGVDALEVISQDKRSERQAKRKDEVEERMEAGMAQDKQFVLLLDSGNTRLKCVALTRAMEFCTSSFLYRIRSLIRPYKRFMP